MNRSIVCLKKSIVDIALDCGFLSHANFIRAFKGAYGITPEEYRDRPVILNQFVKPDLLLNYIMIDEDVPLITDGIVVEVTRRKLDEPRTFLGIVGEVPIIELAGGKTTGIATAGCCTYMAGAEASGNVIAEGYSSYTLPCGEYIVCCFEAENFAELIGSTVFKASSFMNGWMKNALQMNCLHRLLCR